MKNTANDKKTDVSRDQIEAARNGGAESQDQTDFSHNFASVQNGKKSCCKANQELNLKLSVEKTSLENDLKQLTKHFEQKVSFVF